MPLSLPPAYTAAIVAAERDPMTQALASLARGVEDGLLILADRPDRLELALVTEPDGELASAVQAFYAFAAATADMLAAALPPMLAVGLRWPAEIMVDGSAIGQFRARLPDVAERARPPWLILGLRLWIRRAGAEYDPSEAGACLGDCGAGELDSPALAESLARHFLYWLDRLDRDGFAPIRESWNRHCHERLTSMTVALAGRRLQGSLAGIDDAGRLSIGSERLDLIDALSDLT